MADQKPENTPRKSTRAQAAPNGGMRFSRGVFGWVLFVVLAIMLFMLLSQGKKNEQKVNLGDLATWLKAGNVKSITIEADELHGEFFTPMPGPDGKSFTLFHTEIPTGNVNDWAFTQWLIDNHGKGSLDVSNGNNVLLNLIIPLVPWLLIFGFIWFFVFRQLRNSGGAGGMLGNFGRSRHKITSKEHTNVTFDDVAGVERPRKK